MSQKAKPSQVAADRLKSFVERIERLEAEKKGISRDIGDVYAEAKGIGFDTKTMRLIVKARKMDSTDAEEQGDLFDTYALALGMLQGGSSLGIGAGGRPATDDAEFVDDRYVEAVKALRDKSASHRTIATKTGLSKSAIGRLAKAMERGDVIAPPRVDVAGAGQAPPHDPATGELLDQPHRDPMPESGTVPCKDGSVGSIPTISTKIDGGADGSAGYADLPDDALGCGVGETVGAHQPKQVAGVESRPSIPSPTAAAILSRDRQQKTTGMSAGLDPVAVCDDFDGDRDMPEFLRRIPRRA